MAARDGKLRWTGRLGSALVVAATLAIAGDASGQSGPSQSALGSGVPGRSVSGQRRAELERPKLERRILAELAAGRDASALAAEAVASRANKASGAVLPPTENAAAGLEAALSSLEAAARPGAGPEALAAAYEDFEAHDLLVRRELERAALRLEQLGIGGGVGARLAAARERFLAVSDRLHAALRGPVEELRRSRAGAPASLAAASSALARGAEQALAALASIPVHEPPFVPLAAANLPYRRASLAARPPRLTPAITPSYLDPLAAAPGAAELEGEVQAPLSVPILLKAEELGYDAVAIYEFVRNQIAGEIYAGAMKGAEATLAQGSGNDVDQASLLVALLRSSQIPARYVRGVVELSLPRIAAELGLGDPDLVPEVLGRAGLAFRPVIRGGRVVAVEVEHTWVAAYVPYANYRGAVVDFSGRAWVPLAPALKTYSSTPATAVLRAMGLDVAARIDAYLGAVQPSSLVEQLRQEVEGYLQETDPDATYDSQLGSRAVAAENLRLLPSSMPAPVVAVTYEAPALDPADVHRVRLVARLGPAEGSAASLDLTVPLAELVGHRLTLSYTPATVEDHQAVNAWGGLYAVPLYLVQLRPQIKIDGTPRALGTVALDMGAAHRFEVELTGPTGTQRLGQTVLSGSYHALAVGAQQTLRPADPADDPADTERLASRLLSQLAHGYAESWDRGEAELSGLLDVAVTRPLPSVVTASNAVQIETLLGLPYTFRWQGVTLDAGLRAAEPVARRADAAAARDWMRLAALEGSGLEQLVFQRQFQVDGISADRGLALAAVSGLGVVHLTSANLASELPGLNHPPAVKAEIENWVRQGLTADVPRGPVTRNAWTGSVWRVEEPATGAAGYFIAGALAGGSSSEPPESWILDFLAQALAAPYSAEPNTNPLATADLKKVPATDGQEGEVGQPYDKAFAVLARDEQGRPVLGAPIIFTVAEGGGILIDADGVEGDLLVVATDELGIAEVTLKAGTDTSVSPVYTLRNSGDRFATQALGELVEAVAVNEPGFAAIDAPFQALAYPGPPAVLERLSPPQPAGPQGLWIDTVRVQAQDQYDNPVSNVDVTFAAGPPQFFCDPPPASFQNAVVFDFATCNVPVPRLGDCGSASFTTKTSMRGAFGGVILGNATATIYNVSVTAGGLPPLDLQYRDPGSCNAVPLVVSTTSFLSDEVGNNIQAARAGEVFQRPIPLKLLYEWPDYEVRTSGSRCFIHYLPHREWRTTSGQVSITVSNGGSASGPSFVGDHYETMVTTGLTPAANDIRFNATDILTEVPRVDEDTCAESVEQVRVSLSGGLREVFGLEPTILSVAPDPILLTDTGQTAESVKVNYLSNPPDYNALSLEVNIYEDGTLLGRGVGSTRFGAGEVNLQRGLRFDVEKTYEAELIANRGSVNEVRGEKFELPLFQRIFTRVSRSVNLSQDVDILNQRVCAFGSEFKFSTTQEAEVTLTFRKVDSIDTDGTPNLGSETKLIDGQNYPAGDHQIVITPADLLPGDYRFELSGISAVDGHQDTAEGDASSEFRTRDSLPVGHAMYKGVDLFDGHLSVVRNDFSIPGRGRFLELIRSYSSNATKEPGPMGVGWGHNYDSKIIVTPCGEVIVIGAEGGGTRFVDDGNGGLRPLKGYHSTLRANPADSSWDFFSLDGTRYHYAFAGVREWLLDFIEDPNGHQTTLTYDRTGFKPKLVTVTDPGGRSLRFNYQQRTFRSFVQDVVTRIEGPGGLEMSFAYDDNGNLASAAREAGARQETYGYPDTSTEPFETRNQLSSITDGVSGARTGYTYTKAPIGVQGAIKVPSLFVSELEEPQGGSTTFELDTAALDSRDPPILTSVVSDRRGGTWTYTLNRYGSPLAIEDPEGGTVEMTWAADDVVMLNRTDENGATTTMSYDGNANLLTESIQVTDFDGASHTYAITNTYAGEGSFAGRPIKNRVSSTTNRNGTRTDFTLDARGNLTRVSVPGTGFNDSFTYSANGDRRTRVDPNGRTTSYSYDSYGNVATTTDALGGVSRSTWDVRSRRLTKTDALGRTSSYEYDTLDRVIRTSYADGSSERTIYDDSGRTTTSVDAEGRPTVTALDFEEHPLEVTDPEGNTRVYAYDPEGAKTGESNWFGSGTPRADTDITVDGLGRATARAEPLGRTLRYTFDPVGNMTSEEVQGPGLTEPHRTEYGYDALRQRHTSRRTAGGQAIVESRRYDGEGNITLEVDPLGRRTERTFDALNRLVSVRDPRGGVATRTYDPASNLLTETDELNRTRRHEYDALGRRVRRVEALGNATLHDYDAVGNLVREIDPRLNETKHQYDNRDRRTRTERNVTLGLAPVGIVATTFEYDRVGNLVVTRHPNGNREEQTFDGLNRLLTRSDDLGTLLTRTYDANGNTLTEEDANGNLASREYDLLNRLTREEQPEGQTRAYTYDAAGNRLSLRDGNDNLTTYLYDGANRLLRTNDPASVGTFTETTYDAAGRSTSERDRRGLVKTFERDVLGRLTRIEDPPPLGTSQSFTYDAVGNRLTETDRRGIVTSYAYDAENRALSTTRGGVVVRRKEYDKNGNLRFDTDANGNIVGHEYDERNLKVAENRPLAAITRFALDAMGDVVEERDPENRSRRRTHDARRRVLTESDGAGNTITFTYDGVGNRLTAERPEGGLWRRAYDEANRLVRVTNPLDEATEYGYDDNGNRTRATDARGKVTLLEYDALNRLIATVHPGGARDEQTLDGNGNAIETLDPKGQIATFTYDSLDRQTSATFTPSIPSTGDDLVSRSRTYDGNGNLLTVEESYSGGTGERTTTYAYDNFNRVLSVTDPQGKAISYSYDANGNRIQLRDPDARLTTYAYDALNRVVSVTVPLAGVTQYEYFRNSLLRRIAYPNGSEARYTYDLANRIATIDNKQGAAVISSYAYSYDRNSNRTQQIEVNGGAAETTTYAFDEADRLTGVDYPDKAVRYTYDPVGNRLTEVERDLGGTLLASKSSTYDDRNRLTRVDDLVDGSRSVTYGYDANGNQTSRTETGGATTFLYDSRDQLVEVQQDGLLVGRYGFDHNGLRVRKSGSGQDLRYLYDDDSVLLETDAGGSTIARYEYGPDRLLSMVHATEGRQFYLFDGLKSVANLSRPDGTVQARYRYDAWGNPRSTLGSSFNPFGFTGHERDGETGLYYFKARFYDPKTGRFLTADPAPGSPINPPSLHKYLYAYANPTAFVDPTGMYGESGHYYTVYYVALKAGYSVKEAQKLAYFTQLPDELPGLDAVAAQGNYLVSLFGSGESAMGLAMLGKEPIHETLRKDRTTVQTVFHALTGNKNADAETRVTINAIRAAGNDLVTTGLLLHRLGDSFSHRKLKDDKTLYETGMGHGADGHDPDIVLRRPNLYLDYVKTLFSVLAEKRGMSAAEQQRRLDELTPLGTSAEALPKVVGRDLTRPPESTPTRPNQGTAAGLDKELDGIVSRYLRESKVSFTVPELKGRHVVHRRATLDESIRLCRQDNTCMDKAFESHIKRLVQEAGGDLRYDPENTDSGGAGGTGVLGGKRIIDALNEFKARNPELFGSDPAYTREAVERAIEQAKQYIQRGQTGVVKEPVNQGADYVEPTKSPEEQE